MNKKKTIWSVLVIMMVTVVCSGFSSCSGDDDGSGGGLQGWYTDLSQVAKESDFNIINDAIANGEVLSSYRYGGQIHQHIASYSEFIDSDGSYNDSNASFGRLRFTIPYPISAIRIVDDTTILYYNAMLYIEGKGTGDLVYKFYAGSIFGNMAYYDTPTYYTYAIVENKIIISNGDIFTIVDGGLVKDGSSRRWSKYDPNQRY